MPPDFLHRHRDFADLIGIIADERGIAPELVEKDYWIMHCLYGLQQLGHQYELKGGTSLSKGYGLIARFSEDIDIRIEPRADQAVAVGTNQMKPKHVESRRAFYDGLAAEIDIDGIVAVTRDHMFDDERYRSGGIRLSYKPSAGSTPDLKDGILLEIGFDTVTPNEPRTITSWAYDYAANKVGIIDNRAIDVACYRPGYTLVEKLQAISTKFRKQQETAVFPPNFMRHYYDVFCLLRSPSVQEFIGTKDYTAHKAQRFRGADNPVIVENEAFILSDAKSRAELAAAYAKAEALYYQGQPPFDDIMAEIARWANRL
jgi:hypothetical protein